VTADEVALARDVAWRLGFDPDGRGRLADLAAVGIVRLARRDGPIVRLARRDGPVEDWRAGLSSGSATAS